MSKSKSIMKIQKSKIRRFWRRSPVEQIIKSKKHYDRKEAKRDFHKIVNEIDEII